ncbi:MAG TPA: hypothetical protein VM142_16210, partial [Acidimicrobiales bacterium]|nr:hypothetical protein [Acidimicrobiales bacterium]
RRWRLVQLCRPGGPGALIADHVECPAPALLTAEAFDMVRTSLTTSFAMGAHPKEMAERLGHCSVQLTLDRYSHLLPERDKDLTNRLDVEYRRQTARMDVVQETTPEPPGQSI